MHHTENPYSRFALMISISFVAMYILMYAMVDTLPNVLSSINQFYMAGLMTSVMVLIELLVMSSMYPDRRRNILILGLASLIFISTWAGIRYQTFVADEQFLRSMIPHHAGAILMCQNAKLEDAEIKSLCSNIIKNQQSEIDWMKEKLIKY